MDDTTISTGNRVKVSIPKVGIVYGIVKLVTPNGFWFEGDDKRYWRSSFEEAERVHGNKHRSTAI